MVFNYICCRYLHEELLEIQVWVTYHTDEGTKQRPRNRDKLIGSAYINLAPLSDSRRRQHRISNLYPLYKPGASNLGGAFLRAHMTVKANVAGGLSDSGKIIKTSIYVFQLPVKIKNKIFCLLMCVRMLRLSKNLIKITKLKQSTLNCSCCDL